MSVASEPPIPAAPISDAVTVRMYKGLLGDCFLLQLASAAGRSFILIDCGVLQGIQGASDRMVQVANDIVAATGGRIDLLVVTHEHWDHISGFAHAAEVFFGGRLKIDTLWMAWTENDADPQAQGLRARFDRAKMAVAAAATTAAHLAARGVTGAAEVTAGLEAFIGPVERGLAAAGGPRTGRQILQALKQAAGAVAYLEPGQVVATPGATPLKAYVLGPPRSAARLFKALPSAGDNKETYLAGDGLDHADHLLGAVAAGEAEAGPETPFPRRYEYAQEDVAHGGDPTLDWLKAAYVDGPAWRRIDADWLGGAGALALKLDSNTNNTSLVLAFETPAKKVLLFAADAQVGNWLSWYDQTYPPTALGGPVGVGVEDILLRTVVYKMGHHGSHNATLDAQGLERMTDPSLVVFIPVVETDARAQGTAGWNMPFPDILKRALELSKGAVLRGDTHAGRAPDGRSLGTDAAILACVGEDPAGLFVDYRLPAPLVGAFAATKA